MRWPVTLTSGSRLGNYEIVSPLGAGGMGEVYRAHDPRLNREVAIKVLPDMFAADPERLARFQREAQMLAALNHPNIAGIHGLEESSGIRFLVLELVPGETLAELLAARGPLAVSEALDIARQLAEGLEAAHEKGIIHRDLKPANIKLTPEGKIKVLDFGLAKAFATDASGSDMVNSPTLSMAATRAGVLLGTAAYMSPEQARGKALDRRTDVWAFGCVIFELLTGKKTFDGETVSDAVAVILTRDPDWSHLSPVVPHRLRELLRRCLTKDPSHRMRDMGDARIEIEEILAGSASGMHPAVSTGASPAAPQTFWARPVALSRAVAMTMAVSLVAALLVWLSLRQSPAAVPLIRSTISTPPKELISAKSQPVVAISPDGQRIAFVAASLGVSQLFLRALDQEEATPVPGSREARGPFFSPDGQWVAFAAEGKLKKVSVRGGNPIALCDVVSDDMRGASWGEDGWIYLTPSFTGGVARIMENGGKLEAVTSLDAKAGERTHRWPEILPGAKALVFTNGSLKAPDYYFDAQISVKSLVTGETKMLAAGGTNPHYLPSGHLLYSTASGLIAVPFDARKLEVTGAPTTLPEQVFGSVDTGAMHYAVSRNGDLVYMEGERPDAERALVWVDLTGKTEVLRAPKKTYFEPALSPEGKRVAISITGPRNDDIWVLDIERNALTRLTFGPGSASGPLWTLDGKRIAYSAERNGQMGIFWKPADGSGVEEHLITAATNAIPSSFTADGKTLLYFITDPARSGDILAFSPEGERKPKPILVTSFDEYNADISPDGRWMAYVSNESGSEEVYVQAFPGPGGKWQISTGGGADPHWSSDGRALFFRWNSGVASVQVNLSPTFSASVPKTLFPMNLGGYRPMTSRLFSVSRDGKRILGIQGNERDAGYDRLRFVQGWGEELKRLAAGARK